MPAAPRQRRHAAAVDELQARQVNDDPRLAGNGRRERGRHIRGICQVKLPAQRDDNMAIAFAGTQIHAEHREGSLLQQQGGVPAQRPIHVPR